MPYVKVGWRVWHKTNPASKELVPWQQALTEADKRNGYESEPVYVYRKLR